MPLLEVLNAWGATWAAFMLRSLVEATALLAVVLLVWLPLRRRMSSQLAYGLFLLVLVKAAVPIPVTLPAALARLAPGRVVERRTVAPTVVPVVARDETREDRPSEPLSVLATEPAEGGTTDEPVVRPATVPVRPEPLPKFPSNQALLMLAWAAVVLGLTVRLMTVHLRMTGRLRDARSLDPATLPIDLRQVSKHCGLRCDVPLVVTPLVAAPAVWGLVRPQVLFPAGLIEALTPGQLTWVLLHELVHVRRRDGWIVLFQRLVQVVYVFHPAVWVANRIIDIQREFACDDAALALAGDVSRRDCGAGFLAIVERASLQPGTVTPALGLFGTHTFLRRRLMRILDTRRPLHQRLSARGALLLGVAALAALPDVRAQDEPPRAAPALSSASTVESRAAELGPGVTIAQPSPQPVLRIRGQVLDAETSKPIRYFTLIGGRGPERASGPPVWYWVGAFKRMMGGQYDETGFFPAHDRGQTHALRVEADGYRSAVVLGIADDAGEFVHDFRLTRGGLAGFVRTPYGQPAAGAVVLLSPRDNPSLSIVNGQFHESLLRSSDTTTTGSDGRYAFARGSQPQSMTVLHDTGFAHRSIGEFLTSDELTLEPWGRVEGVIRLGNGPGSGLEVGASEESYTFYGSGNSRMTNRMNGRHYRSQTKADADGHFVLDRVQPGPGIVHRVISRDGGLLLPSHAVHVDVPPGGTVKVTLGGTGRPVVGRFTSRDGTVPTLRFGDAIALLFNQPPMPIPPDYASYSPQRKQQWRARFQESEEAKAYERQKRRYVLVLAPDGSFRADDIPPGRYTMTLNLRETLVEEGRTSFRTSLKFQRVLDVPEAEPGREEEPFDAGDAILVPKDHRGPEAGQEVPALAAKTLDDQPLSLADYRGKYVLLDFWATWCAPCRAETPHLKAVFEAFGKDEHFVMLGLSVDESMKPLRQYVAENGLGWTQAFLGRGPSEHGTVDFGVHGIPSIWLIGPDGKVVAKGLRGDAIKKAVAEALAQAR